MVEIGQSCYGQLLATGNIMLCVRPVGTHPELPPPHTMISTSFGIVMLIFSQIDTKLIMSRENEPQVHRDSSSVGNTVNILIYRFSCQTMLLHLSGQRVFLGQ